MCDPRIWRATSTGRRPAFLWPAIIVAVVMGLALGASVVRLSNAAAAYLLQDPVAPRSSARIAPSTLDEAYFKFDYPPNTQTFIFNLTDPETIQEARDILSGELPSRHVMGTIIKEPVSYNPPWSYHLDPETVVFFDSAIEGCDATIQYVEDHLDEACDSFLPGCVWCPWGSRLLEEVTPVPTLQQVYLAIIFREALPFPTLPVSPASPAR